MPIEDYISHIGVGHDEDPPGRGSGRYPYGSGNRPNQHAWDFLSRYEKFKISNPGITDKEIAAAFGYYRKDLRGNYILDDDGNKIGSVSDLKAAKELAIKRKKLDQYEEICWYDNHIDPDTNKHYTNAKIAKLMDLSNESNVRAIRNVGQNGKFSKVMTVADKLEAECKEKGYIDVGANVNTYLDCSPNNLSAALKVLEEKGYTVAHISVKQAMNPSQNTPYVVLCPPGSENDKPIYQHPQDIKMVTDPTSHDNDIVDSDRAHGLSTPPQVTLDRIKIKYDEDGGTERDGMIEIRAVRDENGKLVAASPDLSLGNAKYGQIRIAVEGNRYIKGMAVYNENLEGCDILVNSNKPRSGGVDKALKKLEVDKDGNLAKNMFGSAVVQTVIRDKDGNPVLDKNGNQIASAINFVGSTTSDMHVEGHWGSWSKNLPHQFLEKQSETIVKNQLKQQIKIYEDNYKEIMSITNPTVRKKMLIEFGDQLDGAACDLKAAPIGGQKTRVLLPVPSLKDNECYCPGLENGTTVALVRFPHAGQWEIPILKVNNGNKEAKSFMQDARDAIGINHHNHGVLSGADSDGDTAIVIPMTRKNKSTGEFDKVIDIKNMPTLEGKVKLDDEGHFTTVKISDFDPTAAYSTANPRFAKMVDKNGEPTFKYFKTDEAKGKEMGIISNLITDMANAGCKDVNELVRADMYSMVVIDAKKHKLNYKQAYKDFGIEELHEKYQGKKSGGAASLLSRAKSPVSIPLRAKWQEGDIDPETGEKIYSAPHKTTENKAIGTEKVLAPAGYTYTDANGQIHKSKYMKDANGKDIAATYDGKVVKNKDGSYSYDAGSGKKIFIYKEQARVEEIPKMMAYKDARALLSNGDESPIIEKTYAAYANHCKAMANEARKASLSCKPIKQNKEAAAKYSTEIKQLNNALIQAKQNSPRERQANLLATQMINTMCNEYDGELDSTTRSKIRGQCIEYARKATKAHKDRIVFTDRQVEAINAGAISPTTLSQLLDNADKKEYTKAFLPKSSRIPENKREMIKQLYSQANWSYEEIAEKVGISAGSVANIVNE